MFIKGYIKDNKINVGVPDGQYIINLTRIDGVKTAQEYRKVYFAMRDAVWDIDRQYSKKELHELFKKEVLITLFESQFDSTTDLDESEWPIFLESVKDYVQDNFNIYL